MLKSVVVFCGSSKGLNPVFEQAACQLGAELASKRIKLIYGGGAVGLMGVLARSVIDHGGEVVGIIPHCLSNDQVGRVDGCSQHVVPDMHTRKKMMADMSDAAIVLPGGYGTLEEMFEFVTWAQLQIHAKPCGVVNVNNYFDLLFRFLNEASSVHGFIKDKHLELLTIAEDPISLINRLRRRL